MKKTIIGLCILSMTFMGCVSTSELTKQTEIAYKIGCMEGSYNILPNWKPDSAYVSKFCDKIQKIRVNKELMQFIEEIKKNNDPNKGIMIGE